MNQKINTTPSGNRVLSWGLAIFALGLGVAVITFLSISEANVSYARTKWTALLAMLLAAPALLIYADNHKTQNVWWQSSWTVALAAYLMHFWWSVFRSYHGDFDAIFVRQGFVAYTNFLVTALWLLDVVLYWIPSLRHKPPVMVLRFSTWLLVGVSFFAAAAIFRSGLVSIIGWLLGVAMVVLAGRRIFGLPGVVKSTS